MDYEQILYETRDSVALVTLNRPERLNAWTARMSRELADAFERATADPAVGAIVWTGAGRGFCAGADVNDAFARNLEERARGEGPREAVRLDRNWVQVLREAKPIVAAVNGVAVGVGMTMILPSDVILASDRARFGMFFVKMGLVPELASTYFLVQRMGFGRASEMCLSARLVDAAEAAAGGLVDRLVPHEKLLDEALALAGSIAANPDRQLRLTKQLLTRNAADPDYEAVMRREFEAIESCYTSPEHREAIRAFQEKRAPRFRS
jgi:2-(1,2-epoxy-1,2-dihydrophenyl)acetyl-CoA isomerase